MNMLDYILRFPWVEPLGRTLIHFLWQGAMISVAAWVFLRLARHRSANLRHAFAAFALALCALCPLSTFLWLAQPWRAAVASSGASSTTPKVVVNAMNPVPRAITVAPMPTVKVPVSSSPSPIRQLPRDTAHATSFSVSSDRRVTAVRWTVLLWTAGVLAIGGRLCVGWTRVQLWRGRAQPINDANLGERFQILARQLRLRTGRARVLVSHATALPGPLAMGVWLPVVLLPAKLLERLPMAQIEALLAHELAHIRRHDYLWNLLTSALEVALFYHPAVWFLGSELRVAREECCDTLVAEVCPDKVVYVQALAAVAECRADAFLSVPAPGAARSPLVTRVRRLLGMDVPPEPLLTGQNAGWVLALASVVLAAAGILHSGKLMAQNDEDPNIPTLVHAAPHGRVVGPDGQPIAGARVLLYHAVSYWGLDNRVQEEVVSSFDGGFAFSKPLRFENPAARHDPPSYTLFALAPERAPAWYAVLPDMPEDRVFILTVTPPKPQTYEVVDKAEHPVQGATVWLRYAGKQMDRQPSFPEYFSLMEDLGLCQAQTDASGRATLATLPDTEISVAASKTGFEDEMSCTTPREGVPRFTLRPAATLEGHVTDPLGQPVADAVVSLYPKFRFHQFFLARTDAHGRYRIEKIWSDREAHSDNRDWGKYEVAVRHPRLTAATREITFTLGQTVSGFDLAAVPGTEVVGKVLDPETHAPVVGGHVYVDSASGRQERDTDAKGEFLCRVMPGELRSAFTGPPRGCYVVDDGGPHGGPPTSVNTHVQGERLSIELFLPGPLGKLGTVRGRMETPDGKPAALGTVAPVIDGPRLLLTGWAGNALRGTTADAQGNFELTTMPIGLGFTLSGQTANDQFRGTFTGKLEKETFTLPAPLVLRGTVPAEILLTDLLGHPRSNLTVAVDAIVAGKSLWTQRREFHSGPDGILHLPDAAPGGTYEVSLPGPALGSRSAQASFTVPTLDTPRPGLTSALVVSDQYLVRLIGADGQPIGIKTFQGYEVALHQKEGVVMWSNGPLTVDGRAGPDVIVARKTLVLGKGDDVFHFLIETESGALVRAEGPFPTDGTGRIVARVSENLPSDTAPDPALTDVGAEEIAGRVVGPDGHPIPGVSAAFPVLPYAPDDKAHALSGPDGVFRLSANPRYRYAYLTLSKEGWAPVFLTDVPVGQGFRVTFQNTTRLRGTVGGEHPGRVELLLEKNKFTRRTDSFDHLVRDIQFRTTTDDLGAYDLPMEPGQYRWTATSADGRFAHGEITLAANEARALGASLRRGNDVVLELHDIQTGQPVPGIEVCIMERQGFASISNRPGSERTSDAEGRLRWENLPPGEVQFEALRMSPALRSGIKQDPYTRWWRADDALENYTSRPPTGGSGVDMLCVNVGDNMSEPSKVKLERGVKISGVVVDTNGKGLAGVTVAPNSDRGSMTGDSRLTTTTDADGHFLAYLPAGNGLAYQLCAYFPPWTENAPAANAVAERFDSRPGDERTFRIVMGRGGWLNGRLVTAEGKSAAGFKVTAVAADGLDSVYAPRIVTAGADGQFKLGPLRPGKYAVHPGTGTGAPLRKLKGVKEAEGEIGADGDTVNLGDIALPAGTKQQN